MTKRGKAIKATAKAITYRVLGAIETFTVTWLLTGHAGAAAGLMGVQLFTHTAIYVAHEYAWAAATGMEG